MLEDDLVTGMLLQRQQLMESNIATAHLEIAQHSDTLRYIRTPYNGYMQGCVTARTCQVSPGFKGHSLSYIKTAEERAKGLQVGAAALHPAGEAG